MATCPGSRMFEHEHVSCLMRARPSTIFSCRQDQLHAAGGDAEHAAHAAGEAGADADPSAGHQRHHVRLMTTHVQRLIVAPPTWIVFQAYSLFTCLEAEMSCS